MVTTVGNNDPATILGRAISAGKGDWSESFSREIMSITIAPADLDRMSALTKLAQAGELSPTPEVEIENYRQAGRLLELLKAKARVALTRPGVRNS